ncbi:membrane-associated progesterone receptor component 1 [Lingula anatina]|uniref:Membrane-associated progesterone receptor component 1 n=1 Tax=Lingula anatina TaxID=7574 RepID=A0A1S3I1J9_LINAN|nr:membrane-associated progesterone receptor component 1 [Lingula anatina]|eukprot:XP_013391224.1 membrane-associated progesterone receptor component 1 [Lingula anatina]
MADDQTGGVHDFFVELFTSPLNCVLLGICGFLLYKIISNRRKDAVPPAPPPLPRMKKRDFTLEQLREFDGKGRDGRLLVAVNGKVFDVTRGKRFYGPDGPYGLFAGRDASRGLATFSLDTENAIRDEYDDLSDLNSMQMDSIREWEMQFTEKYDYVGRLLKPGETPREYSDTEDETDKSKDA